MTKVSHLIKKVPVELCLFSLGLGQAVRFDVGSCFSIQVLT